MNEKTELKFTFLGTGTSQGVPPIGCQTAVCLSENSKDKRLRASVMVQKNGSTIVVDCGPDFRYQMLRENVNSVDAVVFTHEHNDHVGGVDDVRPLVFRQNKAMPFFAHARVLAAIKERFSYAFSKNPYPGVPRIELNEVNQSRVIKGMKVQPLNIMHGSLPIYGYLFDGRLAYLTDVKTIPLETINEISGVDVLVLDCLRLEKSHPSHLILDEALAYAKQIGPKKMYLTHISHEMGFHDEVQKLLPRNVFLAYDGLTIRV